MPSLNGDPGRLPTLKEAEAMLPALERECTYGYDSGTQDWLVYHLVKAYANGQIEIHDSEMK